MPWYAGCSKMPLESRHLADGLAEASPLWIQTEEDIETSVTALGSALKGGSVLCIASGGCSVVGFLLAGARAVVAVDINEAQLRIARLKLASLQRLAAAEWRRLWMEDSPVQRAEAYASLRPHLRSADRRWFDNWLPTIPLGCPLVDAGGMEGVGSEIKRTRPAVHEALCRWLQAQANAPAALAEVARMVADLRHERSLRNFGPAEALEGDGTVAEEMKAHFEARFRYLLKALPVHGNPYLAHMLLGTYPDAALPRYLAATERQRLRARPGAVEFHCGDLADMVESFESGILHGADISNVGDYLPQAEWERLFGALHRVLKPGSAVVHRNFVWDQPYDTASGFKRDISLSKRLHARDRSFVYRAVTVDRRSDDCLL